MVHYKSILKVIWEQKLDYCCSKILHSSNLGGGRACWAPPNTPLVQCLPPRTLGRSSPCILLCSFLVVFPPIQNRSIFLLVNWASVRSSSFIASLESEEKRCKILFTFLLPLIVCYCIFDSSTTCWKILRTPSSTGLEVWIHDLQIMTINFMSLRCLS